MTNSIWLPTVTSLLVAGEVQEAMSAPGTPGYTGCRVVSSALKRIDSGDSRSLVETEWSES